MREKSIELTPAEKAKVVRTGEVSFAGKDIYSYRQFEIPNVVHTIDLSNNHLTDFNGFLPPLITKTLVMDDNPLLSFSGLTETHCIENFSALGTPLANLPNFRQLAILAFGGSLEKINGEPVTANERISVSGKALAEFFDRKQFTKVSEKEQQNIYKKLGSYIRRGWVGDYFPKKLNLIEEETKEIENDPISVRAVRLFTIFHASEDEICTFFKELFAPAPPKKKVATVQNDDRLERQQALISFMETQLDELKSEHQRKLDDLQKSRNKTDIGQKKEISPETLRAYNALLKEAGPELMNNSAEVIAEERKNKGKNHLGLREAVANIVGVDPDVGDIKLAHLLRQLNEETQSELSEND